LSTPRRVCIVVAHPDDEILGVGATAAAHAARGDSVATLILAEGATSRDLARDATRRSAEVSALKKAAREAAEVLGLPPPRFGGLPDNRMDGCELLDVVKIVEAMLAEGEPDILYTHHGGDLNIDHRVTHQAVMTACRPLPGRKPCAIYTFETVSSTEWAGGAVGYPFQPQRFVEVSQFIDRKLAALERYPMEMRPFPHARSIEAVGELARLRGSQAGWQAAEAFMVMRETVVL
jgi:LmbE family N-acetylglucosaminyl deacetylase